MGIPIRSLCRRGFSLLEITAVLAIIAIMLSAAVPLVSRQYLEMAAKKTAMDISAIEDAGRRFYVDNNNQWPQSMADLLNDRYLPSHWQDLNPFTNYAPDLSDFNYHLKPNGPALKVYTKVPADAQGIIKNLLPASASESGNSVSSTVLAPGNAGALPAGSILPWPSATAPQGFLICDGQVYNVSDFPGLAAVLQGQYGGDGVSSFGVPDLRGRAVFGYLPGDGNFGALGSNGGSTTMMGDGIYTAGHADTANFVNRVKIAGGSLWGMTGAETAQGVSTSVLNPYFTLNYIIKT